MYPLKQSTTISLKFFAHDANGDPVTGKVDGNWTKRISKGGGAFAALSATVTENEAGWYQVDLDTTATNTLGVLTVYFTASGVKQVNLQFRVMATLTDDLSARLPSALVSGRIDASVGAMAANTLTASAIANDAITAAKLATDAGDEIRTGLATAASLTTVGTNVSDIQTRLPAALISGRLDTTVGAMQASVLTAAAIATDAITAAKLASDAGDEIRAGLATASSLTAIGTNVSDIQTRLPAALISGRLDTTVGAMQANVVTSTSLASTAVAKIWDEPVEGAATARQFLRGLLSAVALKLSGATTTSITTRDIADSKNRLTVTVDANGNRSAVTMDLS